MTKEELIAGLKEIARKQKTDNLDDCLDMEEAHVQADDLLLDYIDDETVVDEFDKIDKWYS